MLLLLRRRGRDTGRGWFGGKSITHSTLSSPHCVQPALVLKGCTSLPEDAKKRLRETVLGC